ncbi:DMR6-like oxygenase 2-like protein, partial [Tanacetum coccineum]
VVLTNCDGHEVKAAHDNETLFDIMSLKTPMELSVDERYKYDVSPTGEEELLIIRRLHQVVIPISGHGDHGLDLGKYLFHGISGFATSRTFFLGPREHASSFARSLKDRLKADEVLMQPDDIGGTRKAKNYYTTKSTKKQHEVSVEKRNEDSMFTQTRQPLELNAKYCLKKSLWCFIPLDSAVASMLLSNNKDTLWSEVLWLIAHPDFHFPHKPSGFSDIASEYVKRTQVIVNELLKVNYCPFLPYFDLARGLMPHTDHGVLTLLYQNDVPGLEFFHNGKWVVMSGVPNAFLVLNADHLEIFSNGVSKSKLHRAVVKDECKRFTLVNANGPSLDTVVGPSPRLVDEQDHPSGYLPMKYGEHLELQTKLTTAAKHAFNIARLQNCGSWKSSLKRNNYNSAMCRDGAM